MTALNIFYKQQFTRKSSFGFPNKVIKLRILECLIMVSSHPELDILQVL